MRQDTISLRRRRLIIAGLIGLVTPAGVFAGQSGGAPGAPFSTRGGEMIVSGRILGPGGKPLAGAAVDASQAGASGLRAGAITDADGRFILTRSACTEQDGRPQSISCRVSHPKHATLQTSLDFARAQLQRDESGVWRAAIGLTLS